MIQGQLARAAGGMAGQRPWPGLAVGAKSARQVYNEAAWPSEPAGAARERTELIDATRGSVPWRKSASGGLPASRRGVLSVRSVQSYALRLG